MKVSFAPLSADAIVYLSELTEVEFGFTDMSDWFTITAYDERDDIMGVLACEPKTPFDWHFSCAITDQRCLSRRLLRTIFKALFSRAVRVTALVDPDNERAVNQVRRMGFVYEGFLRMGLEGKRDALIFGMLADDCLYLPGNKASVARRRPTHGEFNGFQPQAS